MGRLRSTRPVWYTRRQDSENSSDTSLFSVEVFLANLLLVVTWASWRQIYIGHPVDVAENFNRVTRKRRFIINLGILTPAILGIGLSLIMPAPFQWWRLPFGDFSRLNIGDVDFWFSWRPFEWLFQ